MRARQAVVWAAGFMLAATLAVGARLAPPPAMADDAKPADGSPPVEDPPLEGADKKAYDAAMSGFDKRFKAVKNRDELIVFLNELDAERSRPARDWLMQYAKTVKSAEYRVMAFESLAKIGGGKALGFLCGKDGVRAADSLVQRQAVDALAKAGDKRCVAPLLDVLDDSALKMETVGAVCITLAKIDPSDAKVKETLQRIANDRRDTVKASAVEAMGFSADDKAFAFLLDALQHNKNASVRAGAAAGLGHAGRQDAIPALKAIVAGEKAQPVREAAIQSLKDLGATTK